MLLAKSLTRVFLPDPSGGEQSRSPVYRLKDASSISVTCATWEKRIVDLGDGRSVPDITRALYQEQLERGAGLTDIGIWKGLFDRSVADTVGDLVDRGYLQVKTNREPAGRSDMSTPAKRKKGRCRNGKTTPDRRVEVMAGPRHQPNGKQVSPEGTSQRWVPGALGPREEQGPGGNGPNNPAPAPPPAPPHRSPAAAVLAFLTRIARREFGGVNGRRDRAERSKRR